MKGKAIVIFSACVIAAVSGGLIGCGAQGGSAESGADSGSVSETVIVGVKSDLINRIPTDRFKSREFTINVDKEEYLAFTVHGMSREDFEQFEKELQFDGFQIRQRAQKDFLATKGDLIVWPSFDEEKGDLLVPMTIKD